MKFLTNMLGFDNETYNDRDGKASFGRKAIAFLLFAMILLIFVCVGLASLIDPKQSAAILPYYQFALPALGGVISLAFGVVYNSKSKLTPVTPKTTTATTSPVPAPPPAKPPPATTSTATATDSSTKPSDKPADKPVGGAQ